MRTEQFLRGYDACRSQIQALITNAPILLELKKELMKVAQYPYYEGDGIDWHPLCDDCGNYGMDIDSNFCCGKDNIGKIKDDICELRVEVTIE